MGHKHKGQLTSSPPAKHLRKHIKGRIGYKRRFWHRERQALRKALQVNDRYEF